MANRPDSNRGGSEARHRAATHVAAVGDDKKKTPWVALGVAAVVLIAVVAFLFNDPNKDERNFGKAIESAEARGMSSNRGQRGAMTLADSTPVRMGAESTIKIPPGFNAQVRGVGLVGSAHFTPKPGEGEKPLNFRVRARAVGVESKGGAFVVRAYPEDKEVFVKAIDSPLTIHSNAEEPETQELPPGPGMAVAEGGTTRMLSQEESDAAFSWVEGTYKLSAVPLSDALPVLQRWYNTQVKLGDKSLEARPVTAVLKLDSSKEALDLINAAANVHIEFRGDTLTLVDGAPPAAAGKKKGK